MTSSRSLHRIAMLAALVVALSACGAMPAPGPQPTATPAPQAITGSPAGTATRSLTLGDLARRSNEAWSKVRSFRLRFTGRTNAARTELGTESSGPAATPEATPIASLAATPTAMFVSIREVVLPGEQRQSVTGVGDLDFEAIVSGDRLYIRGPLVRKFNPTAPPDAWVVIDAATVPESSALSGLLGGGLPAAASAPLASLPERLAPQVVRDLGTVSFDSRQCRVYGAADTIPATGTRIDYAIALDQHDLPCYVETSVAGVTQGRVEYTAINEPLTIATPAAATPVSLPPTLASPVPAG